MNAPSKRHNVVLLFTDLSASTLLASKLEPEQYGEILEQLRGGLQAAIEKQGGEIIRIDGDGALCLFGYPLAYEDAGRRAVEAALAAHQFASDLDLGPALRGQSLRLHSGIHAGAVLLREGDIVRGRYEVLGDATNVAARVCDAANAGEVLVTLETLGRDKDLFEVGAVRTVEAAGHAAAFPAIAVKASRARRQWSAVQRRSLQSAFVGRSEERRAIRDWLDEGGNSDFLAIHGPAGIGKSRLIAAIIDDARHSGWTTAKGGCEAYLGSRPLEPLLQIAQGLTPFGPKAQPMDAEAIHTSVANARREGPLLLVLDDWQWSDEKSHELLLNLLTQNTQDSAYGPLKILVASRDPWSHEEAQQPKRSVALQPFAGADLHTAIKAFLPGCDAITAETVEEASGGTPLLIEEVCRAIAAGRMIDKAPVHSVWYELAVQARVETLSGEDADLVRLCSVIGPTIPIWLLAAASGSSIDPAQLERLERADFLKSSDADDALQFKHGMTRDAVYAGLGRSFRINAHRTLANIIRAFKTPNAGPGHAAAMAMHLFASEQIAEALPYSLSAGDEALAQGALDRAQFHCREAFSAVEQTEPGAAKIEALRHIIRTYGRASVVDPMPHHIDFFEQLLECAKSLADDHAVALATYWIGSHNYGLGEPRRSIAWLTAAYEQVTKLGASTFAVQIEANLGQSSAIAARYQDAMRYMDTAIESKRAGRDTAQPSTSLAYCLSSRGLVKADMGDFAGAIEDFDASISALVDMNHPILPSLETQRCLALIYFGEFKEAIRRAEFSERMAERTHARFLVFSSRALGNYARFCLTGEQSSFEDFVEASLRLICSGRQQRASYKLAWIAEAMVEAGQANQARFFAYLTFRRALKGDRLGEAIAARALARLNARQGDRDKTTHYLAMADRAARLRLSQREEAMNHLCAADCFEKLGEQTTAQKRNAQATHQFKTLGIRPSTQVRPVVV
ncbi:MAG: AAA family ATPase [Pseudomonadota bacterium]